MMQATPYGVSLEDWLSGGFQDAIIGTWTGDLLILPLLGAMITCGIIVSMYIYSDDMALPTIVLMLLTAFVVSGLPGSLQRVAWGVLAVGLIAAIFEALRRHFT